MNRLSSTLFAVALLWLSLFASPLAEASDGNAASPGLPLVPINVRLQYVPLYFAQSIDKNPRYGRIEALINKDLEHPWYEVILTDKTMGERIFYLNSPEAADILQHEGATAHHALIEFTAVEKTDANPIYQISFHDSDGQQVLWRFVANCQSAEQDARFTPPLAAPGFVAMHANRQFAAAPGTELRIGNSTEAVEVSDSNLARTSISYRAFSAVGLVLVEITPGSELWITDSMPAQITKGSQWVFHSTGGHQRKLELEQAAGNQAQIRQVDTDNPFLPPAQLDVLLQYNSFQLCSISFSLESHTLRISFQPPVPFPVGQLEDRTSSAFVIAEDDQNIAKGSTSVQRALDCEHVLWKFDTPDWARSNEFYSGVNCLP